MAGCLAPTGIGDNLLAPQGSIRYSDAALYITRLFLPAIQGAASRSLPQLLKHRTKEEEINLVAMTTPSDTPIIIGNEELPKGQIVMIERRSRNAKVIHHIHTADLRDADGPRTSESGVASRRMRLREDH